MRIMWVKEWAGGFFWMWGERRGERGVEFEDRFAFVDGRGISFLLCSVVYFWRGGLRGLSVYLPIPTCITTCITIRTCTYACKIT
jgi:hypothetical protein